jgi:phenylacetate-CoA ligase
MTPRFPPEYAARSAAALDTALRRVPGYRAWRDQDRGPARSLDERYAALPSLSKADLRRRFPGGFVVEGHELAAALARGEIEYVETSGTSEDRVTLIWHQAWWDASERASWRLNTPAGRVATGAHREAILTNPLCTGCPSDDGPLPTARRSLGRFLYLNEYADPIRWTPALMERMAEELADFQPQVLEVSPPLLARLSRYLAASGRAAYQPGLIVLTYEYPSRLNLRQIRRAFGAPMASSYGSTETGYVFMECEAGRFHQNVEFCRVDFEPLRPEHGGPALGRILVTTFGNPWAAMLRFQIGDLVRLETSPCPCGRGAGYTAASIEGRLRDVTLAADGRAVTVGELDRTLAEVDGLAAYRLQQTGRAEYRAELVLGPGAEARATEAAAVAALRGLYGEHAAVTIAWQPDLGPGAAVKHRLAHLTFPFDYDRLLDGGGTGMRR